MIVSRRGVRHVDQPDLGVADAVLPGPFERVDHGSEVRRLEVGRVVLGPEGKMGELVRKREREGASDGPSDGGAGGSVSSIRSVRVWTVLGPRASTRDHRSHGDEREGSGLGRCPRSDGWTGPVASAHVPQHHHPPRARSAGHRRRDRGCGSSVRAEDQRGAVDLGSAPKRRSNVPSPSITEASTELLGSLPPRRQPPKTVPAAASDQART